ncbi:MAG: lamin tail domain-containing protein, partial [Bacteroidota bacterium]
MHYPYSRGSLLVLLTLLFTCVRAQTTIAVMDFDGNGPEMAVATDVPFFDLPGTDGFFGIHDANGDDTDGTPMDTGMGNAGAIADLTGGAQTGDFLFVNDLNNVPPGEDDNVGTADFATVTFGPVDISGQTEVQFLFDYTIIGFETVDEVFYRLVVDGAELPEVNLREGLASGEDAIGSVADCIASNASTVSLRLRIKQNSSNDQAAFDNFRVLAGTGCTPSCGVNLVESSLTLLCDDLTSGADPVRGSVNYLGLDPAVTVAITGGSAIIAADSDNPATDEGGTQGNAKSIRFENLVEGLSYTLTVTGGACNLSIDIDPPADLCLPVGDLVINEFLASRNGGVGEFIEIYNRGTTPINITGFTVECVFICSALEAVVAIAADDKVTTEIS